jgi:hypothetical protein
MRGTEDDPHAADIASAEECGLTAFTLAPGLPAAFQYASPVQLPRDAPFAARAAEAFANAQVAPENDRAWTDRLAAHGVYTTLDLLDAWESTICHVIGLTEEFGGLAVASPGEGAKRAELRAEVQAFLDGGGVGVEDVRQMMMLREESDMCDALKACGGPLKTRVRCTGIVRPLMALQVSG